jgi:hypothetical protein
MLKSLKSKPYKQQCMDCNHAILKRELISVTGFLGPLRRVKVALKTGI